MRNVEAEQVHDLVVLKIVSGSLLSKNDGALAVDRPRIEFELACDFSEEEHCRVDVLVVDLGQFEHVGRGVEPCDRIGVGSKGETLPLEDLDHVAFGHMGASVERHMFDEMGKTALIFSFGDRAKGNLQAYRRCLPLGVALRWIAYFG